ncbi:hypothetical protein [Amycolatopsis sp. lyj-109]
MEIKRVSGLRVGDIDVLRAKLAQTTGPRREGGTAKAGARRGTSDVYYVR